MTPPERVLARTLTLTWVFYLFGALYVVGPVLAWSLFGFVLFSLFLSPLMHEDLRAGPPPLTVVVWFVCMAGMLVVLWVGHVDYSLGTGKTIKSSIGWAKGWALFPLFIFIGAALRIRPEIIIRAQCVLGLQTLILLPLFILAPMLGLPEKLYTSPLRAVGGPGPEYFSVYFYTIDPADGSWRWQFWTPWSPFAGLIGVVLTLCAIEERHPVWRAIGVTAGLVIVVLCKSRMSLIGIVVGFSAPRMLPLLLRSWTWMAMGALSTIMVAAGTWTVTTLGESWQAFRDLRANSTRVRDTLQSIAKERWWTEAPWFGHGSVEPGAHVTEHMLIGTHHTWYGLLFVKGAVGAVMFAIPIILTLLMLMRLTMVSKRGRLPLGLLLGMLLFSFGENLEVLVYMLWPALIIIGSALVPEGRLAAPSPYTRPAHA